MPKTKEKSMLVDVSTSSIIKVFLVIMALAVAALLLVRIVDILVLFFVAFFIAAALDTWVDKLEEKKIPRWISVLGIYFIAFIVIGLFIASILPLFAKQLQGIVISIGNVLVDFSNNNIDGYPFAELIQPHMEDISKAVDVRSVIDQIQQSLDTIYQQVLQLGGNIWNVLMRISNGFFNLLILLVLIFFMTVDEKSIEDFYTNLLPKKSVKYVSEKMDMIKIKIGHWIRGQLLLSVIAGVFTYIGLAIVGTEYALTHSLIVAVLMIIPVFGRLAAWLISLPIVLNQSVYLALFLTIWYFIASIIENNFLVPYLMNKAVGLSPILIIFALMVGLNLYGILGLVMAVPVTTIIAIFARDIGMKSLKS